MRASEDHAAHARLERHEGFVSNAHRDGAELAEHKVIETLSEPPGNIDRAAAVMWRQGPDDMSKLASTI